LSPLPPLPWLPWCPWCPWCLRPVDVEVGVGVGDGAVGRGIGDFVGRAADGVAAEPEAPTALPAAVAVGVADAGRPDREPVTTWSTTGTTGMV
jgi:hypothetical protein